ncbi:MAG: ATP-binding cassette domain-containing protein [Anaerolineae bacterium]|nr:ATP-binding cassette domain-containing protein [Anaerolineae bacterium]
MAPFTLSVPAGEIVLVTGPSGCGKSTLARCLSGLIPHLYNGKFSGTVKVNGFQTDHHPQWLIAEQVGFVFQNVSAQMLATSVKNEIIFSLENLGIPRKELESRCKQAEDQFGLKPYYNQNPRHLSGGEQQKVALAASLARNPPILVLDEPLSMLDTGSSIGLVDHLVKLSQNGTTIVICEHKSEYLQHLPACRTIEMAGWLNDVEPAHLIEDLELHLPFTNNFDLSVTDLNVSVHHRPILHNINFKACAGQIVAVVGRNGAGKTTLLRAISGLQAYSGRIHVGGEPANFSMVFQNPDHQIFNSTVQQEILYKISNPDFALYAQLLQLLGLQTYSVSQPLLLSEGEKKRVAMATALMQNPKHGILLDEPSLGQDSSHKTRLMQLARAVANTGRIVMMTTHDLTLASQADRLLVIDKGRIVGDDHPGALIKDTSLWDQIGMPVPDWIVEQFT